MQWLNQNAGAVQAIMAIVICVLTAVLIGVTWWYSKLTRRMAFTLEQQLAASFHPNIEMTLINRFQGKGTSFGVKTESVSGTIVVTNNGDLPLKVASAAMKLVYDKRAFPDQATTMDTQQACRVEMKGTIPHWGDPHKRTDDELCATILRISVVNCRGPPHRRDARLCIMIALWISRYCLSSS